MLYKGVQVATILELAASARSVPPAATPPQCLPRSAFCPGGPAPPPQTLPLLALLPHRPATGPCLGKMGTQTGRTKDKSGTMTEPGSN